MVPFPGAVFPGALVPFPGAVFPGALVPFPGDLGPFPGIVTAGASVVIFGSSLQLSNHGNSVGNLALTLLSPVHINERKVRN